MTDAPDNSTNLAADRHGVLRALDESCQRCGEPFGSHTAVDDVCDYSSDGKPLGQFDVLTEAERRIVEWLRSVSTPGTGTRDAAALADQIERGAHRG